MLQFLRPGGALGAAPALVLALILGQGLAVAPAAAQTAFLLSLDFNGDGIVAVAEAEASLNLKFATVDQDGDGGLSPEEFDANLKQTRNRFENVGQAYQPQKASAGRIDAFTFADSDADGEISRAEYYAHSARVARSLDRDNDGLISTEDITR